MDANQIASVSRQPFRDERGHGAIVFDPMQLRQATTALFDAASYGANAQPVRGQGGRGAAWYVQDGVFAAPAGAVLRQYRRGGWMARFSQDSYFWQGEAAVRSLHELALLRQLRYAGLAVPTPIAAIYRRQGLSYRAAILLERIIGVRSFADAVHAEREQAPWAAVGAAIARCQSQCAHHADLNAHNILLDQQGKVYVIDWDKGRLETAVGGWCDDVLDRLQRSLRKECGELPHAIIERGMKIIRDTQQQELGA